MIAITKRNRGSLYILVSFVLFSTGWIFAQDRIFELERQPIRNLLSDKRRVWISGIAAKDIEIYYRGWRLPVAVDTVFIHGQAVKASGKVLMRGREKSISVLSGDRIWAYGRLYEPPGERNPGEFNYKAYLARKGISSLFSSVPESLRVESSNQRLNLDRLIFEGPRQYLAHIIEAYVKPKQNGALLKGLILGLRGEIVPEIRDQFADVGVVHILAVSGLHVGFVAVILLAITTILRLSGSVRTVFLVLGLFYFAGLTGWKPPVTRAVIMASLYLIAPILERKPKPLNIVASAAFILLLWDPNVLLDPGAHLSFAAVISIFLVYPWLRRILNQASFRAISQNRPLRWIVELLLVSISVQLGTLPITIYYFEKLPVLAPIANLVVIPLVQIIVSLGFALFFVSFIWSGAAQWVGALASTLITILTAAVHWFNSLPVGTIEIYTSSWFFYIVAAFLLSGSCFYFWRKNRFGWAIVAIFAFLAVITWAPIRNLSEVTIAFLDVGQGDACAIYTKAGTAWLVDAGPETETFSAGSRTVVPFLKRQGINRLRGIFISHLHEDHYGGAAAILRQIKVDTLYMIPFSDSLSHLSFLRVADSLHVPVRKVAAGSQIGKDGPIRFTVLAPWKSLSEINDPSYENDRSLVISASVYKHKILFTGDVEHETESYLLQEKEFLHADLLKVAHHGSVTSSSQGFLQAVHPQFAIISVGRWNRFGHPAEIVLKRLKEIGAQTIRTDKNGAALFLATPTRLRRIR